LPPTSSLTGGLRFPEIKLGIYVKEGKEKDLASFIRRFAPKEKLRPTLIDWENLLMQVADGYQVCKGIVHGVQKDAVQNAWDARKTKMGKEWAIVFELIEGEEHGFFTLTDRGTTGLTGRVLTRDELEMGMELPREERWGRFEGLAFLKGESPMGATLGARGRGKFIFCAASKVRTILYDSLRPDGTYRFGAREVTKLESPVVAWDNEEGRRKLSEMTGGVLKPLEEVGTRIIIVDPIDELIGAVKNGEFLRYVGETWWEIILKYGAKISVRVNDREDVATILKEFALLDKDSEECRVWIKENEEIRAGGRPIKIKKLYIASRKGCVPEDIRGISIQRGGMKICNLLPYAPAEIANTVYGYVIFDDETELDLQRIESVEHYNYDFRRWPASVIKSYLEREWFEFAREKLGLGRDVREIRRQIQRDAERVALSALNRFAKVIGISVGPGRRVGGGGGGGEWKEIRISMPELEFPRRNDRRVNYNEPLGGISARAVNDSKALVNARFKMFLRRGDEVIRVYANQDVSLEPSSVTPPFGPGKETFSESDARGKYTIVARLISLMEENRGLVLDEKRKSLYLEENPPQYGFFEDCRPVEAPTSLPKMGWSIMGEHGGYIYEYNTAHPAYKAKENDARKLSEYLCWLMAHELCIIDLQLDEPKLFEEGDKIDSNSALRKVSEQVGRIMADYHSGV